MTVKTLAPHEKLRVFTSLVGSILPPLDAALSHSSNGEVSRMRDSKLAGE